MSVVAGRVVDTPDSSLLRPSDLHVCDLRKSLSKFCGPGVAYVTEQA